MLDAALEYGRNGWSVIPCHLNKRPRVSSGFHAATRSPQRITYWWTRWPEASIGGAVPGMWAVLDVDGETGEATLGALEAAYQPLPLTLQCRTGGGGRHLYFRH